MVGVLLLAILCPPAYCALRRRWGLCVISGLPWTVSVFMASEISGDWPWTSVFVIPTMFLWAAGVALALADAWPALVFAAGVLLVLWAITFTVVEYRAPEWRRWSADQGTLPQMRSAIAIYYQRHGSFPEHPGHYVNPSPPVFHCPNRTYTYAPSTGELRITSSNTLDDCR